MVAMSTVIAQLIVNAVPRNSLSVGRDWLSDFSIPTLGSPDWKVDIRGIDSSRYRIIPSFGPLQKGPKINLLSYSGLSTQA
jgi:hypothetical protein